MRAIALAIVFAGMVIAEAVAPKQPEDFIRAVITILALVGFTYCIIAGV